MLALDAQAREDARADRATRRHLARLRELSPAEIHRAMHCELPPFVDAHAGTMPGSAGGRELCR